MTHDPVPPDAVGLRIQVSAADRDRLRVAAATAGKSMAAYMREVVLAHLDALDAAPKAAGAKGGRRG